MLESLETRFCVDLLFLALFFHLNVLFVFFFFPLVQQKYSHQYDVL